MKNTAILLALIAVTLVNCTKEKDAPEPLAKTSNTTVDNTLYQTVDGDVSASHSYELKIWEDIGSGTYQNTITNTYTANVFPYIFEDDIYRPFYFELVLHNSSKFVSNGKGTINATIVYKGDTTHLEADENTWSSDVTSPVYNN